MEESPWAAQPPAQSSRKGWGVEVDPQIDWVEIPGRGARWENWCCDHYLWWCQWRYLDHHHWDSMEWEGRRDGCQLL